LNNNKKSAWRFGFLLALICIGSVAQAATFVTVRQQNSFDGVGTQYKSDVDGGSVQYLLQPGNRFDVTVVGANSAPLHSFEFIGPDGSLIAPGRYDNTATGFASGVAILDYVKGNTGCGSGPPGYFIVREFQYPAGPDGQPHIAIDYLHRCGAFVDIRQPTHTLGSIRINSSIPAVDFPPFANGGPDIFVDEGDPVFLGAERSYPGDGSITSYRYRQLSGPSVTLAATGGVSFNAPAVPIGGADLSFELEVTNSLGLTSTDVVNVHVDSLQGRRTFVELHGTPGNYVLGTDLTLRRYENGGSAELLLGASRSPGLIRLDFNPLTGIIAGRSWEFDFASPDGQPFGLGNYEGAVGSGSPTLPKIRVGGQGRGCNVQSGRFVVLEFDWDEGAGKARSLAIDFEQHCENTPEKLLGYIRINSAVPVTRGPPDAAAGSDQNAEIGAHVQLDGSSSIPGNGTISSWSWRQTSGTPVVLAGAGLPQASFTAPTVGASGEALEFELTVTNSSGLSDTDQVAVFVRGATQPTNRTRISGDAGEPITRGDSFTYDMPQDLVVPDGLHDRRRIDLRIPSAEDWIMIFDAPSGRELEVGRYDNVTSAGGATPTRAGVSLAGRGAGCTTATGSLRIFEISFDAQTNAVTRLAADFDVRCEQFAGFAHVSVRYQSALPIPYDGLLVSAGADQRVEERATVQLDAGHTVGTGTLAYRWTQVSGSTVTLANASTATASFVAPSVDGAPVALEFDVQVSDGAGHSATDRVRVDVLDRRRIQTFVTLSSDAADWVGRGESFSLKPEEWNFDAQPAADGKQLVLSFVGIERWDLWFRSGATPFQTVTYANATDAPNGAAPVLSVTGRGLGCGSSGSFTVRKVGLSATGALESLVLDFTRHCDGSTAELRGTVFYRAVLPDANVGADLAANEGTTVTLNGGASNADGAQYRWSQTAGPAVTLANATSASASFTAPDVATDTLFTFQLEVSDSAQSKATDSVQVTVHAVTAPPPAGGGSSGGGGGGGGAFTPLWLLLLAGIVAWRRLLPLPRVNPARVPRSSRPAGR
jgi:hypothetical protein